MRNLFFFFQILFCFTCVEIFSNQTERKNVLIDTDVDLDDLLQIFFLLEKPEVKILAITTTSNGKTHFENGADNLYRVLKFYNKGEIPIGRSNHPPLEFNGFYPSDIRKEADHLYDLSVPEAIARLDLLTSSDLIIEKILTSEQKVTFICNGPMTNLAKALKKEPSIAQNLKEIIVVAGALNAPGNLKQRYNGYYNKVAEYNLFLDGKAAEIIFNSSIPITVVPLDVLAGIGSLSTELYRALKKGIKSDYSNFFLSAINKTSYPYFGVNKSISLIGLIAACTVLYPEMIDMPTLKLKLNTDFGPYYGMLSIDRAGFCAKVCLKVNYESLLSKLSLSN